MRHSSARRMFGLVALIAAGCSSASALPSSLARKSDEAPSPKAVHTQIAWRKSPAAHSTAMAQEYSTPADKRDQPIQKANYPDAPAPKVEFPPIPEVMLKEPPRMVEAQPTAFRHGGKHGPASAHAAPMAPLPPVPSESSLVSLPTYTIRPPDVLLIDSQKGLLTQPIRGQHLVRVDGTVGLGVYGPAQVAGRTIQQAREEIARVIHSRLDQKTVKFEDVLDGLSVDVLAYNSSVYYIILDGAGLGEQVYRFPVTGTETVLDAIANVNGLPVVSSPKRIWVSRRNLTPGQDSTLPVDWKGITQYGAMNTNWQIMPGDRVYVQADPMRRFNNNLSKMLEPIERLLGATLLGSQTVNSIRSGTTGFR